MDNIEGRENMRTRLLYMKEKFPGASLSMLSLCEDEPETVSFDRPYNWLADKAVMAQPDLLEKYAEKPAMSEQEHRDVLQGYDRGAWSVEMPVGEFSDITKFCSLYLFACDVMKYTLPCVVMSRRFWKEFKAVANPEAVTRLESNVVRG